MRALIFAATFSLFGGVALSQSLSVQDAFAWLSPGARSAAAYLELTNCGESDLRVMAVSSDAAAHAMLHRVAEDADGSARMMSLEGGLPIPAGASVSFKPGGLHVMFMGLRGRPGVEDSLSFTLALEDGGSLPVFATILRRGETAIESNRRASAESPTRCE